MVLDAERDIGEALQAPESRQPSEQAQQIGDGIPNLNSAKSNKPG